MSLRDAHRVSAPNFDVQAKPSNRDMQANLARYAQLTPELLASILQRLERGELRDWVDLASRMKSQDAHIRAELETRLAPLGGATRVVEPGVGGGPLASRYNEQAAKMCADMLERIPNISQKIVAVADAIPIGISMTQIHWAWDGNVGSRGLMVVKDLEWVSQRRFKIGPGWHPLLIDNGETLNSIGEPLRTNQWIVHRPKTLPGYDTVTGCLIPCAWAYLFKRWALQAWANASERIGTPLLIGMADENADEETREAFREALENLSSDGVGVMDVRNEVKLLNAGMADGGTQQALVEAWNKEMSKAINGGTDTTNPGDNGSRAAVETRTRNTIDARRLLDAQAIASTFEDQVFRPFLAYNRAEFGGQMPAVPKLTLNLSSTQTEITELAVKAGVVTFNELRAQSKLSADTTPRGSEYIAPEMSSPFGPTPLQSSGPSTPSASIVSDPNIDKVADAAMNGAQTQSLTGIIKDVASGAIPRDSGVQSLMIAFQIDEAKADAILGSAGRGFVPSLGGGPDAAAPLASPTTLANRQSTFMTRAMANGATSSRSLPPIDHVQSLRSADLPSSSSKAKSISPASARKSSKTSPKQSPSRATKTK